MFLFKNTLKLTQKNLKLLAKMSTETLKTHKIDVDGQTINYLKVGNGPKTVLCFPGALGTIWSDFKPQLENLDRDKFTIVAWDPPGYGYSRPPNRNFGINFYRDDAICAEKFMNKLGINKYSLLGWSDGGISSMILSAKYPEKVEKLVCWGSNAYIVAEEVKQCETDNRSKRKRHAERRQDFTVFAEKRGELNKMRISPQLTLAAYQYLSTSK
ncbi:unnamed protein product [Diabrotica balteata]|uniref:AB hydrolase-1 domain-containing protein n=1 Tax=Diabrotica balteata TaxID=107213 RepID=A0A9N9XBI6_DIABA|nr:unnamed protein product [Diabrotica balteata]